MADRTSKFGRPITQDVKSFSASRRKHVQNKYHTLVDIQRLLQKWFRKSVLLKDLLDL
jgi:ribonuclease PH